MHRLTLNHLIAALAGILVSGLASAEPVIQSLTAPAMRIVSAEQAHARAQQLELLASDAAEVADIPAFSRSGAGKASLQPLDAFRRLEIDHAFETLHSDLACDLVHGHGPAKWQPEADDLDLFGLEEGDGLRAQGIASLVQERRDFTGLQVVQGHVLLLLSMSGSEHRCLHT